MAEDAGLLRRRGASVGDAADAGVADGDVVGGVLVKGVEQGAAAELGDQL